MNRDDIIRLGRESQRERFSDGGHWFSMEVRDLERFAALVAVEKNEKIFALREEIAALREENERLRDELRQSSIDITRAEIERLRDALEIIAGYRPCIDSLMGNQDIAIAALQGETAIWSARHDPRE